jgi:hypothetical protein
MDSAYTDSSQQSNGGTRYSVFIFSAQPNEITTSRPGSLGTATRIYHGLITANPLIPDQDRLASGRASYCGCTPGALAIIFLSVVRTLYCGITTFPCHIDKPLLPPAPSSGLPRSSSYIFCTWHPNIGKMDRPPYHVW